MSASKRSTIYFDAAIHRALRMKAAASKTSISAVVNEAVRYALAEDASDLEAFEKRRREASLDFEEVVVRMKRAARL